MSPVDHLFLLLLAVGQPIHGAWSYRKYLAGIRRSSPPDRFKLYRDVHVLEWSSFLVLATAWLVLGREPSELGFETSLGPGFLVAAGLLVVMGLLLVAQLRSARRATSAKRARFVESLGILIHFSPHSRRELHRFFGVSVTAGIVEETIYRGFLFWYLLHGMPSWGALLVSSLLFGLGHSYQGIGGMLRVTGVGLAFGGLYLLSGSLWLPILAHMLLDIQQGSLVREMLRDRPDPGTSGTLVEERG
jgi:membrane protease YdiL (CAAX protease family)